MNGNPNSGHFGNHLKNHKISIEFTPPVVTLPHVNIQAPRLTKSPSQKIVSKSNNSVILSNTPIPSKFQNSPYIINNQ